jgi:FMN phosphatase YigB (HAD superfamily)
MFFGFSIGVRLLEGEVISYAMVEHERDPICGITAERLRVFGVKAVLFDLDDTLIYTSELFTFFKKYYAEVVSVKTGIDSLYLLKRLQELNNEEYKNVGVSPKRWEIVLNRLSEELDNSVVRDNLNLIMGLYLEKPRVKPGAKIILNGLRDSGFKTCLVTHASVDWSLRKLDQTGLFSCFDAIEIVDENGPKTESSWKRGMEMLGVLGVECLVVGDNLSGDIVPAVRLGARAIWMPSPWSVYREGIVPDGVVTMDDLKDFWDAVQKLA